MGCWNRHHKCFFCARISFALALLLRKQTPMRSTVGWKEEDLLPRPVKLCACACLPQEDEKLTVQLHVDLYTHTHTHTHTLEGVRGWKESIVTTTVIVKQRWFSSESATHKSRRAWLKEIVQTILYIFTIFQFKFWRMFCDDVLVFGGSSDEHDSRGL